MGIIEHYRPLYVTIGSNDIMIVRILIDLGSSINLMILKALRGVSLDIQHLGRDKLIVYGFNQKGQKTLGSLMLPLKFGNLHT